MLIKLFNTKSFDQLKESIKCYYLSAKIIISIDEQIKLTIFIWKDKNALRNLTFVESAQ